MSLLRNVYFPDMQDGLDIGFDVTARPFSRETFSGNEPVQTLMQSLSPAQSFHTPAVNMSALTRHTDQKIL